MPSEWISRRKREWSEAKAESERQRNLDRHAEAIAESLFSNLQQQVKQDVIDYNSEFEGLNHCACKFTALPHGFRVERERRVLSASLVEGTTVVQYETTVPNDPYSPTSPSKGALTIRADYLSNQVRFWRDSRRFDDLADVSEFLLDPLLCNARDFHLS